MELWERGLEPISLSRILDLKYRMNMKTFFKVPSRQNCMKYHCIISDINMEQAYCDALLEDKVLMRTLTEKKFDVAVIDLFYSECSISLAYHLE